MGSLASQEVTGGSARPSSEQTDRVVLPRSGPDYQEHPLRRLGRPYVGKELKWASRPEPYGAAAGALTDEGALPSLEATPGELHEGSALLTVFWRDVKWTRGGDWIGMWPANVDLSLFHAPIKFKFCAQEGDPPSSGNVTFRLIN